jgi:hypothetical protein
MRSELMQELETYAVQTGQTKSPARLGMIPAFATAAGAALAMTTSADAGIIYSGIQNVSLETSAHHSKTQGLDIKNPGGATASLNLLVRQGAPPAHFLELGGVAGKASVLETGHLLKRFNSGSRISGAQGGGGFINSRPIAAKPSRGQFAPGVTGFAGFVLNGNEDGWIKLKWEFVSGKVELTVISWAYNNTPGGTINAGQTGGSVQTGSVPEPSSLSLALLAAGAAGVLALRKRTRTVAPEDQGPDKSAEASACPAEPS